MYILILLIMSDGHTFTAEVFLSHLGSSSHITHLYGDDVLACHHQVGATTGVALLEGLGGNTLTVVGKTVFGWITTIIMCAATCSFIFAQGAYAPYALDTIELASESTSSSQ